ncbi:MAG: GGDEF domain-containing protein [Oscillospiraceae bacterium]|jgi:GGDEF domain-containing protein|nr:GGDEF domain-containing protein [Oscillospiraceae bacterium]
MKQSIKLSLSGRILLLQDIGMLLFLTCLFVSTMIVVFSAEALLTQNVLMLLAIYLTVILVVFRAQYAAVVLDGFQILAFTVYKLYFYASEQIPIEKTAYLWLLLLLILPAGLFLFIREFSATETANSVLRRQVEELTVIDPLTGLENLRSMYSNLARTMALSSRNGTDMGLMLIKLRYFTELRGILTTRGFERLRQRLAEIVQDTLRLEDRVYSIDQDGSIGVIYFCGSDGASAVKGRLLNAIAQKNAFEGITDKPLRVEARIAYAQYDLSFGTDAIPFCRKVESELQYDV